MFNGLAYISLRFSSCDIRAVSFSANSDFSLKYLAINFLACASVKPSTSSKVSHNFLTFTPASCRAVATTLHFGSTLPSSISEIIGISVEANSSSPSSINKMLDWLARINWKNCCLTSSSISRGRSWSSMASQILDLISRHFSNNTTFMFVTQSWGFCIFAAQS